MLPYSVQDFETCSCTVGWMIPNSAFASAKSKKRLTRYLQRRKVRTLPTTNNSPYVTVSYEQMLLSTPKKTHHSTFLQVVSPVRRARSSDSAYGLVGRDFVMELITFYLRLPLENNLYSIRAIKKPLVRILRDLPSSFRIYREVGHPFPRMAITSILAYRSPFTSVFTDVHHASFVDPHA